MKQPMISILMSVYNNEKYLKEAIESILHQTYQNFEFIIIDDASTDHSWKIIKSFTDKRMKILKNKENIGLTKSLNKGIEKANGEFIGRMDADDISYPERFEKQINFLNNTNYEMVGTHAFIIDPKGEKIGQLKPPIKYEEIQKEIWEHNTFIHGSILIRKKILLDIGLYDTFFKTSQDYDLWLRLLKKYQIVNIPELLYARRVHRDTIENRLKKEQFLYFLLAKIKNWDQKELSILVKNLITSIVNNGMYKKYSIPNIMAHLKTVNKKNVFLQYYQKKLLNIIKQYKQNQIDLLILKNKLSKFIR